MTEGTYRGKPRVTAASIAVHTGLSRATVTHVLNGHADEQRIRRETQQKVLEAARLLGYRPNASARALHTGKTGTAALIQSLSAAYLPERLLLGLTEALSENNMYLTLAEVPDAVLDDRSYLPKILREHTVDGLIINRIVDIPDSFIEEVNRLNTPVTFLNVNRPWDAVYPDDFNGGRMAANYLIGLGHTRILYLGSYVNCPLHYSQIDRRDGYREAMFQAGLQQRELLLPADPPTHIEALNDKRVQVMRTYLENTPYRPTAIVAYELAEALAVLHAAHQLQLRIPQDLSLAMFHHHMDFRLCVPVTTFCNGMHIVGREAVSLLLQKIDTPGVLVPSRMVPIELIEGATCSPPTG